MEPRRLNLVSPLALRRRPAKVSSNNTGLHCGSTSLVKPSLPSGVSSAAMSGMTGLRMHDPMAFLGMGDDKCVDAKALDALAWPPTRNFPKVGEKATEGQNGMAVAMANQMTYTRNRAMAQRTPS